MSIRLAPLLPLLAVLAIACNGDEGGGFPEPPPPAATPVPSTAAGRPPPTDGTVAPQNAGSLELVRIKANPEPARAVAVLEDVRVGSHPEAGGWDRVVFEFKDQRSDGEVEYITGPASNCGSGMPVETRGTALLSVRFRTAQAHDEAGRLTITGTTVQGPGTSVVELRQHCDFEAHVDWAIGTNGRKPFKVTLLDNPTRVVIDVKH